MKLKAILKHGASLWAATSLGMLSGFSAEPKPETLVPEDALAILTIPHFPDAKAAFWNDPFVRLFQDPAMKKYTRRIQSAWETFVVQNLEENLEIQLNDYVELLNGQLTLALFLRQHPLDAQPDLDILLALDSGDEAAQLKTRLADIRRRFADAGRPLQPIPIGEKSEEESFYQLQQKGGETQVVFGQAGSFLLAANRPSLIERALGAVRGEVRSLSQQPAFRQISAQRLRQSYAYGWFNFSKVYRLIESEVQKADAQYVDNPFIPQPTKVLKAFGLGGIQGLFFHFKELEGGSLMEFTMAVPRGDRKGLFDWIVLKKKDCSPLPNVPADVMSFSRTRLDIGRSWANFRAAAADLLPAVNGIMETVLHGLKQGANLDLQKDIFGNLGDDIITISFPPRSSAFEDLLRPQGLMLLGSPDSKALAQVLIAATGLIPSEENALSKKQFEGKDLYSFIPGLEFPGSEQLGVDATVGFHMAVDKGYLVFSMDERILKDYLRSSSEPQSPLRDSAGFRQASAVLGPEKLTFFRYDNPVGWIGRIWEFARENPDFLSEEMIGSEAPPGDADIAALLDFSALPPFEQVAKYFHFTVSGGNSDAQFLNYRFFMPMPPQIQ